MEIIHILVYNMLPLIGIAALGYWLDSMFPIDVKSLTKLTFYIILPSFIFRSIFLMPFDTGMMVLFAAGALLFLLHSLFATGVAKLRGYDSGMREAFRIGTMFSNCGNVGVSMITLIYSNPPFTKGLEAPYHDAAMAAITVLLILMNISMAAKSLPFIAMVTLGIQLHRTTLTWFNPDVWLAIFTRLILGPLFALAIIYAYGRFDPLTSQVFLIFSAVPSAVNSVMFAVDFDNYPGYATQVVMLGFVMSCFTLTTVIYLARFLHQFLTRSFQCDLTGFQNVCVIGDRHRHMRILLDEQNRGALLIDMLNDIKNFFDE